MDSWTMADLAKHVNLLTREHLRVVADGLITYAVKRGSKPDEVYVAYGIATEALRFFFGNDWTNENVFSCHSYVSPKHVASRTFLRTDAGELDQESQFRHQQRVVELAEAVFNMQGVPGIQSRLSLVRDDDLESVLGELRCARWLAKKDASKLRFVIPSGKKGSDYEAEFEASPGEVVCCEIKTKKEGTVFTVETIRNTVEQARKQLPKNKPGVVFLSIPEAWAQQQDAERLIDEALAKCFRQSHRLIAVVLSWEEWVSFGMSRLVVSRFLPRVNRQSNLLSSNSEKALLSRNTTNTSDWLKFLPFALLRLRALHFDDRDLRVITQIVSEDPLSET